MIKERIRNFILCWKYPFLIPRNVWNGKKCHNFYSYTLLDQMPEGWRKAFGIKLCDDLKIAWLKLSKENRKEFMITQIKEKFNTLRIYTNFSNYDINNVLDYYMDLATKYCIKCGQKAKWESTGYIMSFCDECKEELEEGYKLGKFAYKYNFIKILGE